MQNDSTDPIGSKNDSVFEVYEKTPEQQKAFEANISKALADPNLNVYEFIEKSDKFESDNGVVTYRYKVKKVDPNGNPLGLPEQVVGFFSTKVFPVGNTIVIDGRAYGHEEQAFIDENGKVVRYKVLKPVTEIKSFEENLKIAYMKKAGYTLSNFGSDGGSGNGTKPVPNPYT